MKLLTKAIEKKIPALYSTEEIPTEEKTIVCKFFALNSGWTWYVTEGERQEDGDYLFFGLVKGLEKEWGYFSLSELESLRWHGIPAIERDMYFSPVKVNECRELNPQPSKNYMNPSLVLMKGGLS
jgi:hypothetical protein